MAQAYSWTTMPRLIGLKLWKSGAWGHMSVREHEESHISWPTHTWVLTLNPLKVFGVKRKDWRNGLTLLSSIQNLSQICMHLWMEINVVTLQKVVETMPQQLRSVIKAKGGLLQKASVQLFFLDGQCIMVKRKQRAIQSFRGKKAILTNIIIPGHA